MGLSDLLNKAKEWAGKNPDKADKGIDQGSEMLKKRFAGHEGHIETAAAKAKEFLHPTQQPSSEESTAGDQAAEPAAPAESESAPRTPPAAETSAEQPPAEQPSAEQPPARDDQPPS